MLRFFRISCILTIALGAGLLCWPAPAQKSPEPLTEGEIMRLLQGGVATARIGELARERGITFEVTPAVESDLRDAGANDQLIRTLRELAPEGGRAKSKKEAPHSESPPDTGTLLIAADAACKLTVDGEEKGDLVPDAPKRVSVSLGDHLVQAVSSEDSAATVKWTGKVEKPEQVLVQLNLAEKVASAKADREVARREAAENEKAESDLASGIGPFHFGMTPQNINKLLPQPFASVASLPVAGEFRTAEVRYYWVHAHQFPSPASPGSGFEPFRVFEECWQAKASYVTFLFTQNQLMRISVRFFGDCANRTEDAKAFAGSYLIPAISEPGNLRFRKTFSHSTVDIRVKQNSVTVDVFQNGSPEPEG
jgi:hypothetical protein